HGTGGTRAWLTMFASTECPPAAASAWRWRRRHPTRPISVVGWPLRQRSRSAQQLPCRACWVNNRTPGVVERGGAELVDQLTPWRAAPEGRLSSQQHPTAS